MAYLKYLIRPLDHAMNTERPSFFTPHGFSPWAENVKLEQKSIKKRWGYSADRSLGSGKEIQQIIQYLTAAGANDCLILTDSDLIKRETASSKTWSYKTERLTYTSKIASISGTTVTLKTGETPATDGVADGDYFILNDDYTADEEPQSDWGSIASASDGPPPVITLDSNYAGTTGSWGGSEKTGYVRQVYTTPSNERWQYAIVNDHVYFTNGNTDVQYYTGSGTASAVDSTNAKKARCCIEYAQRLVLADLDVSGSRDPLAVKYCINGDPTDWTGVGSGSVYLLESEDYIANLGKVGSDLVVYKSDSMILGSESGVATAPIIFPRQLKGVGLVAPSSLVHFRGINAFTSRNDFYVMDGTRPTEIRPTIKHEFFELVDETEVKRTFGFANYLEDEIIWVANTSDYGKLAFVWDYKTGEWYIYSWSHADITAGGKGGI